MVPSCAGSADTITRFIDCRNRQPGEYPGLPGLSILFSRNNDLDLMVRMDTMPLVDSYFSHDGVSPATGMTR